MLEKIPKGKIIDFLFLLILLGFVLSKSSHLDTPYFWDESWVYAPAVNVMADNGPSILPDAIPLEYSRGHPLLFQFCGAVWINVFGNSLTALHAYALFLSVLFILSLYWIGSNWFNKETAIVAVACLVYQPMFYAQSSLVLPEIFLSLLCLLTLHFAKTEKWIIYFTFGCLAIWTKESAVAIIACTTAAIFVNGLWYGKIRIKQSVLALTPLLSFLLFMLIQKNTYGWYLYPEHTGLMEFEFGSIYGKLKAIFIDLFLKQKKLPLSLIGLGSIIYLVYARKDKIQQETAVFLLIPIIGFSLFSALNFYTVRYILVVVPLLILLLAHFITEAFQARKVILGVIVLTIMVHSIIQLFDRRSVRDINLSYLDYGPAQLEAVNYMEEHKLYDQPIFTGFLTSTALTEMYAGYRNTNNEFSKVNMEQSEGNNYFIFSSLEPHWMYDKVVNNDNAELLKKFEKGEVKFEIYKNIGAIK